MEIAAGSPGLSDLHLQPIVSCKYAGEAAKNEQDKESARILRNVDYMSRNGSGGGYLAAFDGLLDILKRAAKNPTFYDSYSKLAAPFLAVFRS